MSASRGPGSWQTQRTSCGALRAARRRSSWAPLHQAEPWRVLRSAQLVLVDQGIQDLGREVVELRRRALVLERAGADHLEDVAPDLVAQLDGALAALRPDERE